MVQAPLEYPISLDVEPLLTLPNSDTNIMGQNTRRHHTMRDYVSLEISCYTNVITQLNG